MNDTVNQPEVDMQSTVNRVVNNQDEERLRSMCSLLNTFNYAVQVQSNRQQWEPNDFRLFAIALCAMDQIGLSETKTAGKIGLRSVESAMQNRIAGMQK
jgi:hypothetical protein